MYGDLHEERFQRVMGWLAQQGVRSVLDLGCGSGTFLTLLAEDARYQRLLGVEHMAEGLAVARHALASYLTEGVAGRLQLLQGRYDDPGLPLTGFDAAVMIETIEHNPPERLGGVAQTVFGVYRPGLVIVTTPNVEFNPLYGLGPGELREAGHYFEWTRQRFRQWGRRVAEQYGYQVRFDGIGEQDPDHGAPCQAARFTLCGQPPGA
ncbi:MAG: class I SAM-dependent methyltransferase [Alcanivorax sp.]|nr:class I SAM-dependent methyltransferase [Alcanivorax sp.]